VRRQAAPGRASHDLQPPAATPFPRYGGSGVPAIALRRPTASLRQAEYPWSRPPNAPRKRIVPNVSSSRAEFLYETRDTLQRSSRSSRIADMISAMPATGTRKRRPRESYARIVADVTPELKAKATETAHDLGIGVSAYLEWLLRRDLAQLDAVDRPSWIDDFFAEYPELRQQQATDKGSDAPEAA